ncbi:MAG: bifunctional helix-turn-helix transcriptional regulator/GNAT family N-acetyltransferase [Opitutaceae bacterium]
MTPSDPPDLLNLSSRLHRLGRRTAEGVDTVTREMELEAEPRWFAGLRLLGEHGPLGITEIARSLGQTHPAIVQLARTLDVRGLTRDRRDSNDERRRLIVLSRKGRELVDELRVLWQAQESAIEHWTREAGVDLSAILTSLEALLDREPMDERIRRELRRMDYEAVVIQPMAPGEEDRFAELNRNWIEAYFDMEEPDRQVLYHPRETILKAGGQVYMARLDAEIVGTCALLKRDSVTFELAKMAVAPEAHGRQVGARLCDHVIAEAKRLGAKTLLLQTNRKLETAVNLYRSRGWVEDKVPPAGDHYARADLPMRLELEGSTLA